MEQTEQYKLVMSEIIAKQSLVFGHDVAIMRAKKISEIIVSGDGVVTEINGDPVEALKKLIDTYIHPSVQIVAMIESMTDGVFMADSEYNVVSANPAARKILGSGVESIPTIVHIVDILKGVLDIKSKIEEAIKLDKVLSFYGVLLNKQYYKVIVCPVKSSTNITKSEILGVSVVFHDVTHEKEAEMMRNDFTSLMVHELRSPLGNIKKIGELMKSSKILDDKQARAEYVSMLYESASSMLDLVNDLLDVAKLDAGKFYIDKQQINLKEVLQSSVKFFETTAMDAGVNVALRIADGVPSVVQADAKRITQVVNNLLSNGINYTLRGGKVTLECFIHKQGFEISEEARKFELPWAPDDVVSKVATSEIGDSIVVAVTDTGEGISASNIEKLFDKFTQFASSALQSGHKVTGLGLVIVKGIVDAHGGSVGVVSKQGKGSTFYFTLPL